MSFGLSTSLPTSTSQSLNLSNNNNNNNNNNRNAKSVAMLVKEREDDEQAEEEVEGNNNNNNKSLKRHEKKVYMLKRESAKNFEEKLLTKMTDLEEANAKSEKLLLVAANSSSKIPKIEKTVADSCDFSTTFEVNGDVETNAKKNMLIEIKREQQTNSHLSLNRLNVNNRHTTKNSKSKSETELINSIESSEASLNSSNMSSTETSFIQVNEKLVHRGLQTSGLGMGTMGDENIQSFDSSRRSSNDLNMRSHNEMPPRPPIKKIK